MIKHYRSVREKRKTRVRAKIKGVILRPRLSIFRSNRYIYGQIIDDKKGETLVSKNSASLRLQGKYSKTKQAKSVGQLLAKKALKRGIKKVVFDRGAYQYHGRVKALAEGAREGGLEF